jgi:hypothetical protein
LYYSLNLSPKSSLTNKNKSYCSFTFPLSLSLSLSLCWGLAEISMEVYLMFGSLEKREEIRKNDEGQNGRKDS